MIAEIIAVLAESYLAAHLLIQYFGMKEERLFWLKHILFFVLLSISDLLGTFVIKNETFLVLSCLLIEIILAIIFLKGNYFEKIFVSITSYILVYCINFPTLALISKISNLDISELTVSESISRIVCLFITKLMYFAAIQFILWIRKKEKYYFNLNEWIIIVSVFLMTLLIGLAMYNYYKRRNQRLYLSCVNSFIICIGYNYFCIYEKNEHFKQKGTRKRITAGSACTAAK